MTFDINQTDFVNEKQHSAWRVGARLVPLNVSLADVIDLDIQKGCMQIYAWTTETLTDIYNNPDKYQTSNIWHILNDKENFASGIKKYPLLAKYWSLFNEAAGKRKINVGDYVTHCDFRVFAPRYKRSIDDLIRIVPDQLKNYVKEMHEYALTKGAKLESHKYYAYFRYKYKNENVLVLRRNTWRHTPLDIAVSYGRVSDLDNFIHIIETEPDRDELLNYLQKEICACDACGGRKKANERCVSVWSDVHGARRLLAGCQTGINKWKAAKSNLDYHDYDICMLKRLLDVRMQQIDITAP